MKSEVRKYLIILLVFSLSISGVLLIDWSGDGLLAGEDLYYGTNPLEEDTLGNGLTDYEEIKVYGTDPTENDTLNNGLTDYEEIKIHGTDPLKEDTLGNGLTDYEEIEVYETDPLKEDTSGDGLSDYNQIKVYGTDPTKNDTLGNGLTDYEEINIYNTDPLEEDSLGNGLTDYEEVEVYGIDPMEEDTTGDGLSDYDEINKYGTDPSTADTTGDGLNDYEQIYNYETDPLKNDTIGNGLTDYEEIRVYGTNPLKEDTTGDGLTDYEEVNIYGTNPVQLYTTDNGLSDAEEIEIGTNPTEWDSSGDGYPDGLLYEREELDPKDLNILVEIHHTEDARIPNNISDVKEVFDKGDIESDIGSEGINLEFYSEESVDYNGPIDLDDYRDTVYAEDRQKESIGAYHVLFANEVSDREGSTITGVTSPSIDGMLVESPPDRSNDSATETFMHELGHQIGLWPWDFEGIDSEEYSWSEYPSVMNYNRDPCEIIEIGPIEVVEEDCNDDTLRFDDRDWTMIDNSLAEETPEVDYP